MHSGSLRIPRTAAVLGLATALAGAMLAPVDAASHREAPLISQDSVADNTDVYAFVSPASPDSVTMIANFIPFQDPFGGPNFYAFGDDVLYQVNVDNDGDALPDITYEWRFSTVNAVPGVPAYTTATIGSLDDPYNQKQAYTLSVVRDGVRTVLGNDLPVPPVNVGPRTTPGYAELADAAIVDLGDGASAFAGQRDEVFAVDLGSIFDLVGLRPFNEAHLIPLPAEEGVNANDGKNVHSLALEIPINDLVADDPVIGIWATASRRKARVFAAGSGAQPVSSGRFVQVSRMGNPLVNEVVIPIELKDTFNTLRPQQDADVFPGLAVEPFATEGPIPLVTDPIVGDLIETLYPGVTVPDPPRDDLVAIFLTGVTLPDGTLLNEQRNVRPAEVLRLNTAIAPSSDDPNTQNPMGVLGGELDGYPNGRRLGDDVIDIALQAVAGATPFTPDFNRAPNNALGDGARGNDMPYLTEFPYIPHPHNGYDTMPLTGGGVGD